jgi:hypothetical protein
MNRSTAQWTTAFAAAAIMALPAGALAQTGTAQQTPPASSAQREQPATPEEHLRKAEEALNGIQASSVTGPAKTQLDQLKQSIARLERAVASQAAGTTGTSGTTGEAAAAASLRWDTEVASIERTLKGLLGDDSAAGRSATGTVGTSGEASADLDPQVRSSLTEFRTHITAFAAAMRAGRESGAPSAYPASTGGTSAAAGTAQPPASTQPPATASGSTTASTQVDAESAKQYLTAARNSLSEMTQLPAAAQLTGDARTQVTQLISNFNDLITTKTDWRVSYAKVEANLNALLGSGASDESAARAGTSGTAGAVGTAGEAGSLDPGIRAKLVEVRSHLEKFEQAAGGDSAGASMSAGTGMQTAGTTQPAQTTTPQSTTTQPSEVDREEVLRHVSAIEALLAAASASPAATGTSGTATGTAGTASTQAGLTLTAEQTNQLRTHLNELKRLLNEK